MNWNGGLVVVKNKMEFTENYERIKSEVKIKVVDSQDKELIYNLKSFISMLNKQFDLMSFEVL